MDTIKQLYRDLILNAFYDENYAGNPQTIDGKKHGVCIDFSRDLVQQLRENGYLAGVISTLNDDGFNHASVLYKNTETDEVRIADPVTDVRILTNSSDEERLAKIEEILKNKNWKRHLIDYIKEFGVITAYNDDLSISMSEIRDKEELEAVPAINETISKIPGPVLDLSCLSQVKLVADGPTVLACQSLYKKGISTYCTNYVINERVSVNVKYNSLSEENKKIVLELRKEHPDQYFIKKRSGFYGDLGINDDISEDRAMELVFGFTDTKGKSDAQINLDMNNLISSLKKQTYLQDSYTKEEVLAGRHLLEKVDAQLYGEKFKSHSSDRDDNETIAQKEGLIYSDKYNRFFKDDIAKSRYIESLYRNEHDLRTETEIAREAGVYYDENSKMFFETQQALLNYNQEKNFENWSEGNEYLYELFNACNRNNIKTAASCGGHHDKQAVPFISIILDDVSITYINNIFEELKDMNDFWIAYHFSLPFEKEEWSPKNISKSIQIYGTNSNCCELFYRLNKAISQEPIQLSTKGNEFVKKLHNLFFTPETDLYKLVVESGGEITDSFGEKERILSEINEGKHKELQQYYDENENTTNSEVLPADIVEVDMDRKISQTKIEQIKSFFHRIIDFIKGNGAR